MNHVALLIPTLDRIGGAERQTMLLAGGLRSRGWRVTVIALSGHGGSSAEKLTADGFAFISLGMRKGLADPRGWWRLHRWLTCERPEIVHAHLPHAAWMARWSRFFAAVRVAIDTVHTSARGTMGRRVGYKLSKWLPDCVTAVGEGVRDAYVSARMTSQERCRVIPNGVDTDLWRPNAEARVEKRRELGLTGEEFLWFAAGRMESVKDYGTMLRAFAQTDETGLLAIAGTGPMEHELKELAIALEVGDRVKFVGFVPDVRPWMQAGDGFVLSSRWEGLPMGLIEAAACGLLAIATDVAGSNEVIVNGETGWLVPSGSSTLLANGMRMAMRATPEERRAMGDRARELAVDRFSLTTVLERWDALYRELLERNPKPWRWAR